MIRILTTEDDGQVEAGTIDLKGKKLVFDANEGFDETINSLKQFTCLDPDADYEEVASDDAERWYELLPHSLSGSYIRAENVE